jgi:hypothetical protein
MLNSTDINSSLKDCADLGAALNMLSSVGVDSGTVRIAGGGMRGWIVFKNKKVVQAVVAETAQVGQQALAALAELQGARCTFLALASDADTPTPQRAQPMPRPAPVSQQVMDEDEFRAGVFGRDVRSEFRDTDPRLQDLDAPVRRNTHFVRVDRDGEAPDPGAIMLAKAGFTSDFHDAAPVANAWDEFHGDPQNLATGEYEMPTRVSMPVRFFVAAILLALCMSIYVIPDMIWRTADDETKGDLERRQQESIALALADEQTVPVDHPFALPSAAAQAATGASASFSSGSVDDFGDVPPDLSPDTPENLNRLIRWYLRHGKFKKAKELAAKALSLSLMPADRRTFSYLYNQCSGDKSLHMDMSSSTPFGLRKVRELTAAEDAKSKAMVAKHFTIDMRTQPQPKERLKVGANSDQPAASKTGKQPAPVKGGSQPSPVSTANPPNPAKTGAK